MAAILLLYVSLSLVLGGIPSRRMLDTTAPIQLASYDYDKSLVTYSVGEEILNLCVATYGDCSTGSAMADTIDILPNKTDHALAAFGGQERLDRLKDNLQDLQDIGVLLYILSTSWEPVVAASWADMIYAYNILVGLEVFFPYENILSLDDPGPGIPADKGSVLAAELVRVGIDKAFCLASDDSTGNIEFLTGKCDTLHLIKREGLGYTDLEYIEMRSYIANPVASFIDKGADDLSCPFNAEYVMNAYMPGVACGVPTRYLLAEAKQACCDCPSCKGVTCDTLNADCQMRSGNAVLQSGSQEHTYPKEETTPSCGFGSEESSTFLSGYTCVTAETFRFARLNDALQACCDCNTCFGVTYEEQRGRYTLRAGSSTAFSFGESSWLKQ